MIRLSLTDFVDVVSASGTPKATKVRQVKERDDYDPAYDYYKTIRDVIVETHRKQKNKAHLTRVVAQVAGSRKETNYSALASGYVKWWGKKTLHWFPPHTAIYSGHSVSVSVNPELGLIVNGKSHLIKLYFKSEPLSKNRVDIITHLMEMSLRQLCQSDTTMSVLDVRRSKLISPTVPVRGLDGILQAELAYVAALWSAL